MKTKNLITLLALVMMTSAFGQKSTIQLTFSAVNIAAYTRLDSIKVMNRTQGGTLLMHWPDTVLTLNYPQGIPGIKNDAGDLQVFQNYPNPMRDQTTIKLYVPSKGRVSMMIKDMLGRQVISTERMLNRGFHYFRFTSGDGNLYFFTARWKDNIRSIEILNSSSDANRAGSLEYLGSEYSDPQLKATSAVQNLPYNLGDLLLYIGYAGTLQSGILDSATINKTYTFQFATNIPCPGATTVSYSGQDYNTIEIFSQCWLKENLNVGALIPVSQEMADNGIIEKYCYKDSEDSCSKYGGLYQWNEVMQYTIVQGTRGICPPGWHVPSFEDWKVLNGAVESIYRIGDDAWDQPFDVGFNVGLNLKSIHGWQDGVTNTDRFGFSALPGGYRFWSGSGIFEVGSFGHWWTTMINQTGYSFYYRMSYDYADIYFDYTSRETGYSVRCVKDN
jgi:uncharacterized protein (TIGR02145 family)